ncbi:MAG: hypothetical protein QOJ65_1637, partial [Fimbriimonadaceae bacterium]|nr:hypothetical protein [Fimbriimonadaceae bacterium]
RKKAAAEELSRLYAPLLLRLRAEDSRVVLEGCLHNSLEGVSSVAKLEAFDLFSGSKLTSLEGSATLEREGRARLLSCIIPAPGALEWRGEFGGAEVTAVIGSTDAYEGEM